MTFPRFLVFTLLFAATLQSGPHVHAQETEPTPEQTVEPTPASTPSVQPTTDALDPATMGPRIAALDAQIADAEVQANAERAAELGVSLDYLKARVAKLKDVRLIYERIQSAGNRQAELGRAEVEDVTGPTPEGGAEDGLITLGEVDALREELQSTEREIETLKLAATNAEKAHEEALEKVKSVAIARRQAREAVEQAPPESQGELRNRWVLAQHEQDAADANVVLTRLQSSIAQRELELEQKAIKELKEELERSTRIVVFSSSELEERLEELSERKDELATKLRAYRRDLEAHEARREDAREKLQNSRGDEAIERAKQTLEVRDLWTQSTSRAIELIEKQVAALARTEELWQDRWDLHRGASDLTQRDWTKEYEALLEQIDRDRQVVEARLNDIRTLKLPLNERLANWNAEWGSESIPRDKLKALEFREQASAEYLAALIAEERLAKRFLAEINTEQGAVTFEEKVQRFISWAKSISNRELFTFRDRALMVGPLVKASLIFIGFMLGAWVLRLLFRTVLSRQLKRMASRDTLVDDVVLVLVENTRKYLLLIVAIYLASRPLPSFTAIDEAGEVTGGSIPFLQVLAIGAILLQIGLWLNALLTMSVEHTRKIRREADPSSVSALGALSFFGKAAVWSVIVLIGVYALDLSDDLKPLLAGVGISGIAIAFALQNILGDIFCSIAILLDKPFVVGDFIIVGTEMGVVEQIGMKTTRLRSLSGEQIIFANADLIGSRVRNYKRMYERRIVFSLGIVYSTPANVVESIPRMIREIIQQQEFVRFDRSHFQKYGASSLDFEVVYYVLSPDYNLYMDIQQEINMEIFRAFEAKGIEFAYPTQTIHLERTGEVSPAN